MTETFDWAVVDAEGVVLKRFSHWTEATDELANYPIGSTVERVPDTLS